MAFVLQDQWVARPASQAGVRADMPPPGAETAIDRVWRDIVPLALTLLIHALMALLIARHLFGADDTQPLKAGIPSLTLIDLPAAQAVSNAPPRAQPPTPAQQPADVSPPPVKPPPVEWSVTPVRMARASDPPAASPTTAIAVATAGPPASAAPAGGGGAMYDPYAGASPLRPNQLGDRAPPSIDIRTPPAPAVLARVLVPRRDPALVAFAARFVADHRQARGTVIARVRIGAGGAILSAQVTSSQFDRPMARAFEQALLGLRLVLIRPPMPDGTIMLDPIQLPPA